MANPYESLPPKAFWRRAVAERNMLEIEDLWVPKFRITQEDTVATAGSCFAQHISRAMIENGFSWLDSEPAPASLPEAVARDHGYCVFSFRTGNIYTAANLRQWVEAAFGFAELDPEVWEKNGRFHDPLRPSIEPDGFGSVQELMALRAHTLRRMKATLSQVKLFVFTLGLTESWRKKSNGFVYAACPGTVAGQFDPALHEFHNQAYPEILDDMNAAFDRIRVQNPGARFLVTVSPVPLVATAAPAHVLVSTMQSKSVLRAVAGDLHATRSDTDYFPSYEIINATPFRGSFFMPNQREVSKAGVAFVMKHFFAGLQLDQAEPVARTAPAVQVPAAPRPAEPTDVYCEEVLLEAFAR